MTSYLLELYNSCNDPTVFHRLINAHRRNHNWVERHLVRQTLHDRMVYNRTPEYMKGFIDEPNEKATEFYTYIKLPFEIRESVRSNGLSFAQFLELISK